MILAGDVHTTGLYIQHRMIAAVVTEGKSVAFCPACKPQQLVPQADSHHRYPPKQFADCLLCVAQCRGVGRAIGQKYTIRPHAQNLSSRSMRRDYHHLHILLLHAPQDIVFYAKIVRHNSVFALRIYFVCIRSGHARSVILPVQAFPYCGKRNGSGFVHGLLADMKIGPLGTVRAQMQGK